MLDDQLFKYHKLKNEFSNKKRIKDGLVYMPDFFINYGSFHELFGVIKGIKPVVEINFHDEYIDKFNKAVVELEEIYNLKYKLSDYKFLINSFSDQSGVVEISDPRRGLMSASISFDMEKAEKSESLFLEKSKSTTHSGAASKEFAKLMGYPECCIEFTEKLKGGGATREEREKNLLWSKIRIRSFMESEKCSRLLNHFTVNPLIPHTPCNLNCRPSKNYARKMMKAFQEESPELKNTISYFLDLHALFWHYSEKFLIDGEKCGNSVKYNEFVKLSYSEEKFHGETKNDFKLKIEKTENLLDQGDEIIMNEKNYQILKKGSLLGEVEKEYKYSCLLF